MPCVFGHERFSNSIKWLAVCMTIPHLLRYSEEKSRQALHYQQLEMALESLLGHGMGDEAKAHASLNRIADTGQEPEPMTQQLIDLIIPRLSL